LLGIARGVIANRRRGERRRRALRERLVSTAVIGVDPGPVVDDPGSSPVLRALASLRARDREVLLLVAWDGLDRSQASRVLGISTSLFALRLHRARRRLVHALEAQQSSEHGNDQESAAEAL
jgi:RNA polymerase sigma-70 factor (ECF subfamily)